MNGHEIALWAGVSAFFGSLVAIGVVDIFNPDEFVKFMTAVLAAAIAAGTAYSKQRLDDAKKKNAAQ